MESYYTSTIPLDREDNDQLKRNDELEEINSNTREAIDSLRDTIFKFKKEIYADIVSGDKIHSAEDMGAMMSFHALFLQMIGYWIGLLDSSPVPAPTFKTNSETKKFNLITKTIKTVSQKSQDARTLIYSLLSSFSTGHPFDLGSQPPENNDMDE
jgi:hypothetical protein